MPGVSNEDTEHPTLPNAPQAKTIPLNTTDSIQNSYDYNINLYWSEYYIPSNETSSLRIAVNLNDGVEDDEIEQEPEERQLDVMQNILINHPCYNKNNRAYQDAMKLYSENPEGIAEDEPQELNELAAVSKLINPSKEIDATKFQIPIKMTKIKARI